MMIMRLRWKLGCAFASGLCLMLVMACVLIGAVIQRHVITPPTIHVGLGSVQIVAYSTSRPNCPPYGGRKPPIVAICSGDSIFSSAQAYTVWLMLPGRPSASGIPRTTFRRLVLLPLE